MQTLPFRPREPVENPPTSSFLTELLFPLAAQRRTTLGILLWWESRRLVYNAIVGACGLVTLLVMLIANSLETPHDDPTSAIIPVLIYGVLANVCYTLGPIIEVALERAWKDRVLPVGPPLFRQGLAFSVGLTLLPIPLTIAIQMARMFNYLFFHQ